MSKPVLVGYDPIACDRAPVEFGVAAARFTGAPLTIVSVHGVRADRLAARQMTEELLADAGETLAELEGELHAQGVAAEYRDVEARARLGRCTSSRRPRTPGCWSSARRSRGRSVASCPAPRRSA